MGHCNIPVEEDGPAREWRYAPLVMAGPIQSFPDGPAGTALVLLRTAGALSAWPAIQGLEMANRAGWLAGLMAGLLALSLALGLGTRAAALLLLCLLAAKVALGQTAMLLLWLGPACAAGALALLGPGAYSLDALRFGRRVIRLAPGSPDRGRAGSPPSGLRDETDRGNV